jgi:hypothetical protein
VVNAMTNMFLVVWWLGKLNVRLIPAVKAVQMISCPRNAQSVQKRVSRLKLPGYKDSLFHLFTALITALQE